VNFYPVKAHEQAKLSAALIYFPFVFYGTIMARRPNLSPRRSSA
jgi:hypothetical protein